MTARPSFQLLPLRIPARALFVYGAAGALAWALTLALETGSSFWNLAAKCLVAIVTYFVVLYALDSRVRSAGPVPCCKLPFGASRKRCS